MGKKKFLSLFALVLFAVLALGGKALALDRGIYDASKWQDWVGVRIDTVFSDWPGDWRRFGAHLQCFMTARLIIYKVNEVNFNQQTNGKREINLNTVKGVGSLAGESVNEIVKLVGQRLGASTEKQVRDEFSKARVGDLVQFYRSSSISTGEHTIIISGFYEDGIDILHGGWYQTDSIVNQKFTYAQLANWFEYSDAGFSIYRFGKQGGISISDTFPDSNFQSYIRSNIDTNGDGRLNASEIANVTEIKVANSGISDLTGIKTFYNLSWLECNNNSIKTLDLSGMKKLTSIWCWENGMESLNVSGCTELPCIWAKDNNLKTLNVEGCNKLDTIYAWNNGFTSLTINNLPKLKYLDLSNCKSLKELDCSNNVLETLYVGNCAVLEKLTVNGNKLTSIGDLSTCTKLKYVNRDSNVQLTGCSAPVITTSSLSNAAVGKEYYAKVNASGTGIITYTLSAVAKSNGFLCDGNEPCVTGCTNGIINGIPKYERDSLTFTVKATNFVGYASKTFTIKITPQISAPVITNTTTSLNTITGLSFNETLTATGNPTSWAVSSGSLPPGLSLNKSTGVISGKATPTEAGKSRSNYTGISYSFYVTAANAGGTSEPKKFTIKVEQTPEITTSSTLKSGIVKAPYSVELQAVGTSMGMAWKLKSGALPDGLSQDQASKKGSLSGYDTATISGIPLKAGTYEFTMEVAAGRMFAVGLNPVGMTTTKTFKIIITEPVINYALTPSITVKKTYSSYVTVSGGTAPYTWSFTGNLPKGLEIKGESNGTIGRLSGTPEEAGTYDFTLIAIDNNGAVAKKDFSITVTEPVISGNLETSGVVNQSYSSSLTVSGGTAPYTWSFTGNLPKGLEIKGESNGTIGRLSGTPEEAGTYDFTLIAIDNNGAVAKKDFSITVTEPVISGNLETSGVVNQSYSSSLTVSGGTAPYTWSYTGNLPDGLNFTYSGATATISGKLEKAGTFNFTLTATDNNGATASKSFTLTVTEPVISGTFNNGVINAAYNGSAKVSGGTSPYTWKYTGKLPQGLDFSYSDTDATLSGTPEEAGTFNFTLTATDKNGAVAEKDFSIKVTKPKISGTLETSGVIKKVYSSALKVSGGTAPYTWEDASNVLPAELKLVPNSTGTKLTIKGKPKTAKKYTFTLKVTDANKATASKKFSIKITKPTISGTLTASGVIKATYSSSLKVSGGTAPYKWEDSSKVLPAELKLVPNSNGTKLTIKGKPKTAKKYTFTLKVTDANKAAVSKKFTITITKPAISGTLKTTGVVKTAYSSSVTVKGGTAPYTWTKSSGTLPSGLKLVPNSTGTKLTIKGKPKTAKKYTFTLKVTDKNKATASKKFTVTISKAAETSASKTQSAKKDTAASPLSTNNLIADDGITAQVIEESSNAFVIATTPLYVISEDILWQGEGRDEDLIDVKAGKPINFVIGEWVDFNGKKVEVFDAKVYINDELADDIVISEENTFTIPAEVIGGDFRVYVKAQSNDGEILSEELFISIIQ